MEQGFRQTSYPTTRSKTMSDLSIQFHALPEEVIPLVCALVDAVHGHVAAIRFRPFGVVEVSRAELVSVLQDETVRRVAISLGTPALTAAGMNEFLDHNSDALLLDLGRRRDSGLAESWLTARAKDAASMVAWSDFARQLRSITRTGVVAVNQQTGAIAKLKDHRFSVGARALATAGVPMLPVGGSARLKFDE